MNLVSTNELTVSLGVTPQRVAALAKQLEISSEETEMKGRSKHYHPNAVKKILSNRGVDYNVNEVMAFCNNKGGVGKTSLAINTALRLSSLGFKVLLIDADPQSNSSTYLLSDHEYEYSLYDVIKRGSKTELKNTIIQLTDNFHIVPSSLAMARAESELVNETYNQSTYFAKKFKGLDYNYIVWDLSPSLGLMNMLALASCSLINIVTVLSDFSVQGLEMTKDMIERAVQEYDSFDPKVKVIINMFDSRMTSSIDLLSDIKKSGLDKYQGVVRVDNNINKSQASRTSLPTNSNAAKDVNDLVDEIVGLNKFKNATLQ